METLLRYFEFYFASTLRYLLLTGIFFVIFYKLFSHKYAASKIQLRKATRSDFFHEIVHSLQSNLVMTLIAVLLLLTPIRSYSLMYSNISDFPILWLPLSLLLALILHDTYFYWMHRLLHHSKLFRLAHAVHHKSVNPSPFASYSFHFVEAVAEAIPILIIAFVVPMHPLTMLAFAFTSFLINIYGHLGYEIMPESFRYSFWFKIINSSVYHNMHHKKSHGNYGLYFRVWDRLMQTENPKYEKEYDKIQQKRFATFTAKQQTS